MTLKKEMKAHHIDCKEVDIYFIMEQIDSTLNRNGPMLAPHQILLNAFSPVLDDPSFANTKKRKKRKKGGGGHGRNGSRDGFAPPLQMMISQSNSIPHRKKNKKKRNKNSPHMRGLRPSKSTPSITLDDEKELSVLQKVGKIAQSMEALRVGLIEVDDDKNMFVDFNEFWEALENLNSSLPRMIASTLFFSLAARKKRELKIDDFLKTVRSLYELNRDKSCDEVLDMLCRQKKTRLLAGRGSLSSMGSSMADLFTPKSEKTSFFASRRGTLSSVLYKYSFFLFVWCAKCVFYVIICRKGII